MYEPAVVSVMRKDDLTRTFATIEEMGTAAADGRLVDAVRAFADAHVRELPGLGHFAPLLAPAPVADELIRFLSRESLYRSVI